MTQKASETKHMTAQYGGGYKIIDDSTHDINHRYDAAWPKDDELETASLDPAPDHSDWNAAIEAAAKVVEVQPSWKWGLRWVGRELAAAIRALKKGTPQ